MACDTAPPPEGVVRILLPANGCFDATPSSPEGHAEQLYQAVQRDWPGALLVSPQRHEAVLRGDPVPKERVVALLPCTSLPLVLPAEFRAHLPSGGLGERDVGFAQQRE
eukprot:136567-Alexandrium_andersonii.AAC.1